MFITLLPDLQLADLTSETMTGFFKLLQERKRISKSGVVKTGVKKSTIATYWSKLSSFFSWLARKGLILSNPFSNMRYPSVAYVDRRFLKREEVEKILTAIYLHQNNNLLIMKRNILIFNILLYSGLRREELVLLQIRDIDFQRKTIMIRAETSKSGTGRLLPLHPQVINSLKDYLPARKKYTTPHLLVSSNRNRELTIDGLKHLVLQLRDLANINFSLHQFRHTFAVNFLKQSDNIFKLKELLGHKDITMTAVYLRCLPVDEMRGDVEKMSIDSLI